MRTGNESLVNMLAARGLIIAYDRLRRLSRPTDWPTQSSLMGARY